MFGRLAFRALRNAKRTATRSFSSRAVVATRSSALLFGLAVSAGVATAAAVASPVEVDCAAGSIPPEGIPGTKHERTFIAVKPDGVNRGLVGEIIARFEKKGYKLVAIKLLVPTKKQAQEHYADLSTKGFFDGLTTFFSSGPIVGMVWEGTDAIRGGRRMLGETDPLKSQPGSIRGDLCIVTGRNIIHGSDAPDSAKAEINMWFRPEEVWSWTPEQAKWVYEN